MVADDSYKLLLAYNAPVTKRCSKCGEVKASGEFYKQKTTRDGLNSWCKECTNQNCKDRRKKEPGKYNAYQKEYYIKNSENVWAYRTLSQHGGMHLLDDVRKAAKRTKFCPICRCELKYCNGPQKANSATLDRIDNMEIVAPDDIWIICRRCNTTKSDRSMAEFVSYCMMVAEKFGGE